MYMINTKLTDIEGKDITGSTYHNLPIISETELPHGTYTVYIKHTNANDKVYIDGVRIINTINDQTEGEGNIYYDDQEDKPVFHEIRDYVLNAIDVEELGASDYIADPNNDRDSRVEAVSQLAGQVYNALGEGTKAVVIDDDTTFTKEWAQNLLDNGPKNELYLYPGQTLAFSVTTNRVMQLGLKAPTGSARFTLLVDGEQVTYKPDGITETPLTSIASTVDMFYKIAKKGGTTHTVSITVSDGVLSVTDLKICDDPNATFTALTQEDIEDVLLDIYGLDEDEITNKPDAPVKPEPPAKPSKPSYSHGSGSSKPSRPSKPAMDWKNPWLTWMDELMQHWMNLSWTQY